MDKTAIKRFAMKARTDLIEQIKLQAQAIGITATETQKKLETSTAEIEYYRIGKTGDQFSLVGKDIAKRQKLVAELDQRAKKTDRATAFNGLVEEVAYTWFNRIVAIRFMEVNDYLPDHTSILSSTMNRNQPDILWEVLQNPQGDQENFTPDEQVVIQRARDTERATDMDALYRMLFIKKANELNASLPYLFEKTNDYTELLFTPNYNDGVIHHLITDISADDFDVTVGGQVEIIGWLYQYYNTEPKEHAIGMPKSHKFRDTEIASATQIFTPDWIVKYMVQNSLGKIWVKTLLERGDTRDEAMIARSFGWTYYMVDAEQPNSVKESLLEVNDGLKALDITDIRMIDPSMGSGHILVYAFDVFMDIYVSEGYSKREATSLILNNNLNGLDIDTRAFQLSYFAIMMKARQYNRRALTQLRPVHILDVPGLDEFNLEDFEPLTDQLSAVSSAFLKQLLITFEHGNELGSLISIDQIEDLPQLQKEISILNSGQLSFELIPLIQRVQEILTSSKLLGQKYQVVVTNPPYMGSSRMNAVLSKFAKKNYPDAKSDLFSMFIERWNQAVINGGYNAMVTMQSWMFLSSFEKMRTMLLKNYTISNLMHMENNVMGIAFGTAVSIFRNVQVPTFIGTYHQIKTADVAHLVPDKLPIPGNRFNRTNQANFAKIPGMPIAYWASENLLHDFEVGTRMDEVVDARQGIATTDNKRFLRMWYEVINSEINYHANSTESAKESEKKWFPCNKGGAYRKWYGNYDYIINYQNDGVEIKNNVLRKYPYLKTPDFVVKNTSYYFREAITWSDITSGNFSMRYREPGSIHNNVGMSAFSDSHKKLLWILGLMNSPVGNYILKIVNPTIHLEIGNFNIFPVIQSIFKNEELIDDISDAIFIEKADWNVSESSWDFQQHPLILHIADEKQNQLDGKLKNAFEIWQSEAQSRFDQLKANEEQLNKIFIDLYGLNDELSPEVADKDVSVRLADEVRDVKSFLSYFVGVVLGRYSLDVPGLAFAGGTWDSQKYQTFQPNEDNVLMLNDADYFGDSRDLIYRLREFLTVTFGAATVDENIAYMATVLGKKADSDEAAIRKYFVDDFFKDHNKIYQKRPIYWEFSSGKNAGFKALMYLHRYDTNELAMLRTDYLHPLQGKYENRLAQVKELANGENVASQKKRYEKESKHLEKQIDEIRQYDAPLQHLANQQISLDLDDGVLVNHAKLQGDEKLLTKLK